MQSAIRSTKLNGGGRGNSLLSYLNTVIAGSHSSVLDLDVGGRMGELAVGVGASALLPLIFPAHLELEPAGVLLVQEGRHVEHRHSLLRRRDDKRGQLIKR